MRFSGPLAKLSNLTMVTLWTLLFSLQAGAAVSGMTVDTIPNANSLNFIFDKSLVADMKAGRTDVMIDVEFLDQRWDDDNYAPRREAQELSRKITQLNAQYQQAMQSANSLALLNPQNPSLASINETGRAAHAQAQALEKRLSTIIQSSNVHYEWQIAPAQMNDGKNTIDLGQVLTAFQRRLEPGIEVKVRIASVNSIQYKTSLLEWNGDLLQLLQMMKQDRSVPYSYEFSPQVKLVGFNNRARAPLNICQPCQYR